MWPKKCLYFSVGPSKTEIVESISLKCCSDIHGPQRINPTSFPDPVAFLDGPAHPSVETFLYTMVETIVPRG